MAWVPRTSGRALFEIHALPLSQRLRTVVAVVKLRIQVARLESDHGSVWSQMHREAAIAVPQILAIGRGCGDRGLAQRRNLPGYLSAVGPGVAGVRTPEHSVWAKLDVHHRPHRLGHRPII